MKNYDFRIRIYYTQTFNIKFEFFRFVQSFKANLRLIGPTINN